MNNSKGYSTAINEYEPFDPNPILQWSRYPMSTSYFDKDGNPAEPNTSPEK